MKSRLLLTISSLSLLSLVAMPLRVGAQEEQQQRAEDLQRYTVTDLGPVGNPFSQASYVNNAGLITGLDSAPDGSQHAVLWYEGLFTDIGTPGLGGPNSGAGGANEFGQVIGGAETSNKDPNNENFCGYGTGLQCVAFLWQNGVMTPLPTLGGTNGGWGAINNRGEVAGYAEEDKVDSDCPGQVAVNGTGPQVLYFEPVIWGPMPGEIRKLRPLSGDSVGVAFWINDNGQAVGMSGSCANTVLPAPSAAPHAALWERDGSVHDLGNLGGTVNTSVLGVGNVAFSINNRGQVAGVSALPGNATFHPFLWTSETGMQDLGVLPGDLVGASLGMNNEGDVVGASISAPGIASGNPRAFLRHNGAMSDLNALVPANTPLYLLIAYGINDSGEIAGFGVDNNGDIHAFLATPCDRNHVDSDRCEDAADGAAAEADKTVERRTVVLSEDARKLLQQRLRFNRFGVGLTAPQ
jgi:probable HAF family extracellular repeat protein